jgi:hypothetical protein
MQLFSYLKGLFHRITRGQIKASCDAVVESLQKHTLPSYTQASELFKLHKLSSKEAKDFITEFNKVVGAKNGETMIDGIKSALENAVALLTQIGDKSDAVFSDVESTLGMTFQKAMYLRLISSATFANDYARQFLNYLYVVETAGVANGFTLQQALSPAERQWVEGNFSNFCVILSILDNDVKKVFEQLDELPDAIVSEGSENAIAGAIGTKKLDPLGFRGLGMPVTVSIKWNPFYLIGTIIADYRAAQYKCAKEEVDLLQMRKLHYEKLLAKQPDARLEAQIEYMADRVSKLNFELHEMEKKYG